jgi:uncharacterized protein YhaN
MRLRRLHIPAFGPFTDLDLAFPNPGNRDLHLIFGENEAGKSSLLRAIRDLLFGIHGQSRDGFLHDYKNLRLVGEVENKSGDHLVFQRRKGNKNTLLDAAGEPLPDSALQPFLGGVGPEYFSTMFGLGGTELREGARELLSGEGELGAALFSASLGGTPIHRVIEDLNEQAGRIFRGKAKTTVSLRPAIARYKELLGQCKEALVKPEEWERMERDLETQGAEKRRLEAELAGIDKDLAWIERVELALPSVSRLLSESKALAELPALPTVGSDFVERARSARDELGKAVRQAELLAGQVEQLKARLGQCATAPAMMARAATLDLLHREVGAYGDRKKSLAQLQAKLASLELALRAKMEALPAHNPHSSQAPLESLEALRLERSLHLRCETAARELHEAQAQLAENQRRREDLERAIEDHERELAEIAPTDLEPLREALAIAADAIDANKTLPSISAQLERLSRHAGHDHALVLGAPADFDATAKLPVPSRASLRKFRERFDQLQRDRKAASERIREEEWKLKKLSEELHRLERLGELPTEASLKAARERRELGWALVLSEWKAKEPHGSPRSKGMKAAEENADLPLEEAYPKAVAHADQIADQLRLHAEAVAQAQEKRLQIATSQSEIQDSNEELGQLDAAHDQCFKEWKSEWLMTGVEPGSPDEMEEWCDRWEQFRDTLAKLREAEELFRAKSAQVEEGREALALALDGAAGQSRETGYPSKEAARTESRPSGGKKSFSALFEAARRRVQKGEEAAGRRTAMAEQLAKVKRDLAKAGNKAKELEGALESARANWFSLSNAAGVPEGIAPEAGLCLLRDRQELIAKFDHWRECLQEARQMAGSLREFEERVQAISRELGFQGEDVEVLVAALWEALCKARAAQVEHDQLEEQIAEAMDRLELTRKEERQSRAALEEILALGKLGSAGELEPLLAALEERAKILERAEGLRETLGGLARGQTLEEFLARVQEENPDQLPARKALAEASRKELAQALQATQAVLGDLQREKMRLEQAGDQAAFCRQQAESQAATLRQEAARFLRLKLAAHFLQVQVEQFRRKNQGPLLAKSGEIFSRMTRGAFEELDADFNEKDVPVLIGRRAGGAAVAIEAMSEGTRDQLFLSLRLAALDHHLQSHEPMPLILDDLLITFDNERVQCVLPILAELSTRTQILLFTHHRHLVELCQETLGEGHFQMQSLGGRGLLPLS